MGHAKSSSNELVAQKRKNKRKRLRCHPSFSHSLTHSLTGEKKIRSQVNMSFYFVLFLFVHICIWEFEGQPWLLFFNFFSLSFQDDSRKQFKDAVWGEGIFEWHFWPHQKQELDNPAVEGQSRRSEGLGQWTPWKCH